LLGNETWISLRARKSYVPMTSAQKGIFTERFETRFKSGERMTNKVQNKILKIVLLMGDNRGEKIFQLMNMPVSSSTLIRSIHQDPAGIKTPSYWG
jgi:hypothetical protein